MRAKTVTLYSLPCVVAIASLLVAAHEIAPLARSVGVSHGHHAGQTVNRAWKGDRLPIRHGSPKISPKARTEPSLGLKRDVIVDPQTA
jgi:hypothetical protein